jgi:hypothetical protein
VPPATPSYPQHPFAQPTYGLPGGPAPKKRRKWPWVTLAVVLVFVVIGAIKDGGKDTTTTTGSSPSATSKAATTPAKTTPRATAAPAKPADTGTTSQRNALRSARSYLEFKGFSKKGLIRQLSSSAGEGYPKADAVWAVAHLDVDWKEQAVKAGRSYLDMRPFSRAGLIQQLSSDAGEGFTKAEAAYAADKLGL